MVNSKTDLTKPKGHTYLQWTLAILANMTVLVFGFQMGWVSPATKVLQSTSSPAGRPLTDSEISWLASLPPLPAMIGVLASSYLVDVYGRKTGVLVVAALQAVCWIIKLSPSNVSSLMVARTAGGLSTGACFHVVPMYVKEISQASIAGTLGSLLMVAQNLGILLMYILGAYLNYYTVLWMVVGIPIAVFVMFLKAPESPAFLVKMDKIEQATSTIAWLRGLDVNDKEVQSEIDAIKRVDDYFKSLPKISFIMIFKNKPWRRGFLIMLMVTFAHGHNGTYAIVSHASSLLASSGLSISPDLQSLSIPIFTTVGSFVALGCMDKIGRKVLLSTTHIIIAISLACLASTQLLQTLGGSAPGWLPVLAMAMALFAQGAGVSPVPYVVMLEIFKFQIRAKVIGILVLNILFTNFTQLLTLEAITAYFGSYTAFYWFAAVNVFGAAVVIFVMPETRGKTIEQVENELTGSK